MPDANITSGDIPEQSLFVIPGLSFNTSPFESLHLFHKEKQPSRLLSFMAEAVGFEPTSACALPDFERFAFRLSPSPSVPNFRLFRRKSDRICACSGKNDRKVIDTREGASLLYCELSDVYSIPLYPFFSAFPSKYRNANAGIRRRFFPPGVL